MHPLFRGASVIPVLTIEREADARSAGARALRGRAARLSRSPSAPPAAAAAIAAIAREMPQVTVGAGTLLRAADVAAARAAGARFLVSPGMTAGTGRRRAGDRAALSARGRHPVRGDGGAGARHLRDETVPGRGDGRRRVAARAGPGIPRHRTSARPAASTSAAPSDYLALPNVPMVGGSWMAPRDAIAAGDWARIRRLAERAAAIGRAEAA